MSNNCPVRTDNPNKTAEDLLSEGWVFLDGKYKLLIKGILMTIKAELDRNYWNVNQKEMVSPFENSGAHDFTTNYLTIRSYNWGGNYLPNLDTDQLKVFWYKHSNRGIEAIVKNDDNIGDVLADVLNNSVQSIIEYFDEPDDDD